MKKQIIPLLLLIPTCLWGQEWVTLPEGWEIEIYAEGFYNVQDISFGPDEALYVGQDEWEYVDGQWVLRGTVFRVPSCGATPEWIPPGAIEVPITAETEGVIQEGLINPMTARIGPGGDLYVADGGHSKFVDSTIYRYPEPIGTFRLRVRILGEGKDGLKGVLLLFDRAPLLDQVGEGIRELGIEGGLMDGTLLVGSDSVRIR